MLNKENENIEQCRSVIASAGSKLENFVVIAYRQPMPHIDLWVIESEGIKYVIYSTDHPEDPEDVAGEIKRAINDSVVGDIKIKFVTGDTDHESIVSDGSGKSWREKTGQGESFIFTVLDES